LIKDKQNVFLSSTVGFLWIQLLNSKW